MPAARVGRECKSASLFLSPVSGVEHEGDGELNGNAWGLSLWKPWPDPVRRAAKEASGNSDGAMGAVGSIDFEMASRDAQADVRLQVA